MLPYLAQGANSSLEDGAVLGCLLGKITAKSQLPLAIEQYQKIRKHRAETVAKETFKQVRFNHHSSTLYLN
jgi:salicylate hydroxylase